MATRNWDAAYEASPAGTDSAGLGDNKIRDLKVDIRERRAVEHVAGITETQANHGWHREGSARAFVAGKSDLTDYNDPAGTTIGDDAVIDDGRLLFDTSQANLPFLIVGTTWTGYIREIARLSIQGVLATGNNVVPPMVFPRAGTIAKITAAIGTPPVGSSIIIDVNIDGSTIFSHANSRLTIADGASQGSLTSGLTTALLADDYLTFDIDQVGSSTPGANIGVTIEVVLG